MMKRAEEDKVRHSGLLAEIGEQFKQAGVETASAELFGLFVDSTEGEDLDVAQAVEDSQRLES